MDAVNEYRSSFAALPAPSETTRRIMRAGRHAAVASAHRRRIMQDARRRESERRAALAVNVDSGYTRLTPLDWLRADEARGMLPTDGAMVTERRTIVTADGHIGVVCETRGVMVKLERLYWDYRAERDDVARAMRESNVESLADVRASTPWRRSDLRRFPAWDGTCYRVEADGTRTPFVTEREALLAAQREALRDATPPAPREALSEALSDAQDAARRMRETVAHLTANVD